MLRLGLSIATLSVSCAVIAFFKEDQVKANRFVLLLILLFPTSAFAGKIFGNLTEGGRSVGQGVEVQITCGGSGPYSTSTDVYGAYTIDVPRGTCELSVKYPRNWTPPFSVVSPDDPARYDFELVSGKGGYVLKRR
jgi:hypothetical protein